MCDVTVSGIRPAKTSFLYCAVFVHDIEVVLPKIKVFLQWVSSLDKSLQTSLSGEESASKMLLLKVEAVVSEAVL